MKTPQFLIEKVSPFPFEETVEKIIHQAELENWNVPATQDLQKSLAKSGINVKPVKVIEICKPEYSGKMLELNDERIMSVMMPCRISVYEKNDGKTYLAVMNPGIMASEMPEHIAAVMKKAADDSIAIIDKIADKYEMITEPAS